MITMEKKEKIKLSAYAAITAFSFYFLISPRPSGISVPIFAALQFLMMCFVVPQKKKLIKFIPIFILSLNYFISGSRIWHIINIPVFVILLSAMFADVSITQKATTAAGNVLLKSREPFSRFHLPFKWFGELTSGKGAITKKIIFALLCALVCVIPLIIILSGADMVFDNHAGILMESLSSQWDVTTTFFAVTSTAVGLYLFGMVHSSHDKPRPVFERIYAPDGDLLTINTVLGAALTVYTIFCIIQFKYLFAGSTLPAGLSYAEYARKGFFELLGLSFANIVAILLVVFFTQAKEGNWAKVSRLLCCYLCAVTMVLLVSSYYRLSLYTAEYGLTRLRLFVMGFLFFEAIGLVATFVYILKPRFNVVYIYGALATVYYLVLNIVPVDYVIAENHVNKYIENKTPIPEYVFELSSDAAPAMEKLFHHTDNAEIKNEITTFFTRNSLRSGDKWQSYNLSIENSKRTHRGLYSGK